jgi:D-serine deaminase-like pyridoxal phosphate-dependent protein
MRSAPFAEGVTEGRPGTYVYFDGNQTALGSCEIGQCASSVVTRVVSVNRDGSAIIDAGSKAMSADSISKTKGAGTLVNLDGSPVSDLQFIETNEEHGFLAGSGTDRLKVGDLLRVIPHHACGTTNMWSKLLAVHPDGHTEEWPIVGRH